MAREDIQSHAEDPDMIAHLPFLASLLQRIGPLERGSVGQSYPRKTTYDF